MTPRTTYAIMWGAIVLALAVIIVAGLSGCAAIDLGRACLSRGPGCQ